MRWNHRRCLTAWRIDVKLPARQLAETKTKWFISFSLHAEPNVTSLQNLETPLKGVNVPRRKFVYVFARHKDLVSWWSWMNRRLSQGVPGDGKSERELKSQSLRRWWVEVGVWWEEGGGPPTAFLSTCPCANSANGGLISTPDQVEDTLPSSKHVPEE